MRAELGIKVNSIEPIAATRIFRRPTEPAELTPEAVASAAVVLASSECPVTGTVINAADGMFEAQTYPTSNRQPLRPGDPAEALLSTLRGAGR